MLREFWPFSLPVRGLFELIFIRSTQTAQPVGFLLADAMTRRDSTHKGTTSMGMIEVALQEKHHLRREHLCRKASN